MLIDVNWIIWRWYPTCITFTSCSQIARYGKRPWTLLQKGVVARWLCAWHNPMSEPEINDQNQQRCCGHLTTAGRHVLDFWPLDDFGWDFETAMTLRTLRPFHPLISLMQTGRDWKRLEETLFWLEQFWVFKLLDGTWLIGLKDAHCPAWSPLIQDAELQFSSW